MIESQITGLIWNNFLIDSKFWSRAKAQAWWNWVPKGYWAKRTDKTREKSLVQDFLKVRSKPIRRWRRKGPHGVMVSTLDFDFSDPSSNLGGTLNTSVVYFYNNNKQQPISFTQEPIYPITYQCNNRYKFWSIVYV